MSQGYIHCLTAICMRGCQKQIMGTSYKQLEEEFSDEETKEFEDSVKSLGWSLENGYWYCKDSGCRPPWDIDFSQFHLPKERLEKFKKVKIDPDFYGQTTVTNLEE